MCGRVACTLAPDDVCRTCRRQQGNGKWSQPKWKPAPDGGKYYPSHNAAPTNYLPVMVSKKHFEDVKDKEKALECAPDDLCEVDLSEGQEQSDFVIQPMRWGLIPPWHKGEIKSSGYNTINARSDTMCSKNTYKVPLQKGRRCVVLVDGYFEWQKKAQPYYIYHPEEVREIKQESLKTELKTEVKEENIKAEADEENIKAEVKEQPMDTNEAPKKLLTCAGVFDIYRPKNGDPPLYSYSMITVDSHKSISWLHDRMPAVLSTEEEIEQWLDFGNVPLQKAVELIRPVEAIKHHPVSTVVNNVRNKTPDCVKPIDLTKKSASSNFMTSWLATGKKRKSGGSTEDQEGQTSVKQEPEGPEIKKKKS